MTLIKRKQDETNTRINNMSAAEIQKENAKAYGGAAACLAFGPLAIFACPIAYGVAAGVTQAVTIKKIIADVTKRFDATRTQIDNVKTSINAIGTKTKELVEKVEADKARLVAIQEKMKDSQSKGKFVVKFFDNRMFTKTFNKFKTIVTDLMAMCNNYLATDRGDAPLKLE